MDTKLGSRRNLLSESPLHPGQSRQGLWPGPNSKKLQVGFRVKGASSSQKGTTWRFMGSSRWEDKSPNMALIL